MYIYMYIYIYIIIHKLAKGQVKVLVTQLCMTLCNSMGCNLPGSPVLKFSRQEYWVDMPSSRVSSLSRVQTQVSRIAGRFFTV